MNEQMGLSLSTIAQTEVIPRGKILSLIELFVRISFEFFQISQKI